MATYTYDISTSVGQVRLLIADTDVDGSPIYSDEELAALLEMEGDVVKRGAARALEVLAANRARLAVRVTRGGVSEDLTQVAAQLREVAKQLRAEAEAEEISEGQTVYISPDWDAFATARNVLLGRTDEVK